MFITEATSPTYVALTSVLPIWLGSTPNQTSNLAPFSFPVDYVGGGIEKSKRDIANLLVSSVLLWD